MLKKGIYEQVINREIGSKLDDQTLYIEREKIDGEEAAIVLAQYMTEKIQKSLGHLKETKGVPGQIQLCNNVISLLAEATGETVLTDMSVENRAEMLLALLDKQNSLYAFSEKVRVPRPVTSIAQSSLFTGAVREPSMFEELRREIASCDRIDILVSFIKWSGLRLILNELREFAQKGKQLRVITTSYMGATDVKAIEELRKLPNTKIKISYDTKRTRLHAKTYIFYRETGYSTAYVGSSNLSNAAISSGLEWNVKVTEKDLPATMEKIAATFETYWNDKEFSPYSRGEAKVLARALRLEKIVADSSIGYYFEIHPYPFQQEILDKLQAERQVRNRWRNLVVAATGTGKTVVSAFDYKRFRESNPGKPCNLLFIAHREEILKQSRECFRGVLKDYNFGELFVGRHQPTSLNHLFMSVQTFNAKAFDTFTSPGFYDYIVVDEFHHAAAFTYQKLLAYYQPRILLGLTATPERMDGQSILEYFDNRIAAEIRLPEAIERKLLCPFQYFGVTDTVDLDSLKWTSGGYDKNQLTNLYSLSGHVAEKRARMIIESVNRYVTDINSVKGLGFCVSKDHARFMAKYFNENGLPSMHLTSESPDEERNRAKSRLVSGEIRFIFVVDLYNEGVDIPEVDTILFLRPTESLTVFLQQLGRGLRLAEKKECLTVLDFIGQANKRYNFQDKFKALLANTKKGVTREIKEGFVSLPKGCYIQLEKKAKEHILNNIRSSFGQRSGLISMIAAFEDETESKLTLARFLEYYHLDPKDIYEKRCSFSRLCVDAGVRDDFCEPDEPVIAKAFARISSMDSRRWINYLLEVLPQIEALDETRLTSAQKRMLLMLHYTIWGKALPDCQFNSLSESLGRLKKNPVLFQELLDLLQYCYDRIDFVDEPVLGEEIPLDLYCTYTRDQIMTAVEYYSQEKMPGMREGVRYIKDKKMDIFLVTLNKAEKDYSPSTMYNDYSIDEYLFHWQSQSTTSEVLPTGQRYINHKRLGSKILLFVREFNSDKAGAIPFTFLGLADYVSHKGSKPMNIILRLQRPIPAKYLKTTKKLTVG